MTIGKDLAIATAVGAAAYTGGASLGLIGGAGAAEGAAGGIAASGLGAGADAAWAAAYAPEAAGLTGFQELSLGASALSGIGQIGSSMAAEKSAKYNAAIAGNNAQIASQNATTSMQEGEANAAAASMAGRAKIGGMLANQGASGVDVNSGSSVDTRASAAEITQLNSVNIRSQAAKTAYGFETQGVGDQAQQNMYNSEAAYAPIQGAIGAGTSLLSGAAAVNSPWASHVAGNSLTGSGG